MPVKSRDDQFPVPVASEPHLGATTQTLGVLVVDDDQMQAEFIGLSLEAFDCEVRLAHDGESALELLDEDIDLLVADWRMPGMDGVELVENARAGRSAESYLHIVMMTARGERNIVAAALAAGVDDFLTKPVDTLQLQMALASARRNRALHRRLELNNQRLIQAHDKIRQTLRELRRDISAAAELHERLLPQEERLKGVGVSHLYRPAATLGGDTIGASLVDDGRTLFFLIDVRGHGVPAALDSFHLHHRLKQLRPSDQGQLEDALATINAEICERADDSYATIACGIVDPAASKGWIITAGHPAPVLLCDGVARDLPVEANFALGWFENTQFAASEFAFAAGSRLAIYSDGLSECCDESGALFDSACIARFLDGSASAPLGKIADRFVNAARLLTSAPGDDVSLLVIESRPD